MARIEPRSLPRLAREHYQGFAIVHWTHCIQNRATGWLNASFHVQFREALIHASARYEVASFAYVLMPDHFHTLSLGLSPASDQLNFSRTLRKDINHLLSPQNKLQPRPHDHVLRKEERKHDAVASTAHYILENPVRAAIVAGQADYPFSGGIFPGYFGLDPRKPGYDEIFWKLYKRRVEGPPNKNGE